MVKRVKIARLHTWSIQVFVFINDWYKFVCAGGLFAVECHLLHYRYLLTWIKRYLSRLGPCSRHRSL